nr:hypothetical protein [Tanacetum cinerariifolium]
WSDSEVVRLLAISSPPASPLSPWSSPPPQIPFPPLPPLPSASHRENRPEVTLPPQKRLGIALGPRYEVGDSSSAAAARPARGFRADYGFVTTMDREIMRDPEREVGYGITDSWDEFVETLQDTDEIYMRLDDEQTERQLLAGRLNMLFRDRRAHAYIRQLMETEARMSREAWVRSTDASDLVNGEVMSLPTTTEIRELQAADHMRQTMILELLRIDHRRSTEISELRTALQGQVTALQGQVTAPLRPNLGVLQIGIKSLDYVPGPEHADDEIVAEDQPYAEDASPIAQSPEYVLESNFKAHLEDDDDEDPEEDPVDYLADGGDDGDDEEESSEDDEDDDMDIKADKEEEEEHPALADSIVVASTAADQAPSAEETEPF